jgi:hypothetical protein
VTFLIFVLSILSAFSTWLHHHATVLPACIMGYEHTITYKYSWKIGFTLFFPTDLAHSSYYTFVTYLFLNIYFSYRLPSILHMPYFPPDIGYPYSALIHLYLLAAHVHNNSPPSVIVLISNLSHNIQDLDVCTSALFVYDTGNEWMDEWMNEWMYTRINEWMDGWMNEWMHGWINKWKDESMNQWMNKWTNEWINQWMNERMNRWMNKWKDEWPNGWMDEWMNDRINECMNQPTNA